MRLRRFANRAEPQVVGVCGRAFCKPPGGWSTSRLCMRARARELKKASDVGIVGAFAKGSVLHFLTYKLFTSPHLPYSMLVTARHFDWPSYRYTLCFWPNASTEVAGVKAAMQHAYIAEAKPHKTAKEHTQAGLAGQAAIRVLQGSRMILYSVPNPPGALMGDVMPVRRKIRHLRA